jgi:Raf kinase inhibitor-like YbhB/YbcL family protein
MRVAFALLGLGFFTVLLFAYIVLIRHHETPALKPSLPMSTLTLTSTAFAHGASIPQQYTCDGKNINPPLGITGVPKETASLVLFVEDPDIPQAVRDLMHISVFDHWVLFNIPSTTTELTEGTKTVGVVGNNTRGPGYTGPCPPPQHEPREHRYIFSLSALDTVLELPPGASKEAVQKASAGHILETAVLIGRYKR